MKRNSPSTYDRVNAERRRLPMVKIEKDYVFDGPNGKPSLKDLFEGRRQLIVYHFMFDPAWEQRLPGLHGLCRRAGRSVAAERNATRLSCSFLAPRWPSSRPIKRKRDGAFPVVFLVWQRFQLRFSRDA